MIILTQKPFKNKVKTQKILIHLKRFTQDLLCCKHYSTHKDSCNREQTKIRALTEFELSW